MVRTQSMSRKRIWPMMMVFAVGVLAAVGSSAWAQGRLVPTVPGREVTVLLFPASIEAENAPPDLSRWTTTALQTALDGLQGVICLDFSRSSPLVRRAVDEGRVRAVDLDQAITDPGTAIVIGHAMEANIVFLVSVQSYKVTTNPEQVEVVLSGRFYDVKSNIDEQTLEAKKNPQVLQAVGVVGRSTVRAHFTGDEGVLAREALRDAAYRIAQVASGTPVAKAGPQPVVKKRGKAWRWFVLAAVVAGLAAVANNSSHHSTASPAPPSYRPRNLVADVQPAGQNAINCTWLAPEVTTNLLGYELQRAIAQPGSTSPGTYQTIASYLQLPPGQTSWVDSSLNANYVYYYRLRARYSDRQPTDGDWIYTGGVRFSSSG